MHPSTLTFSPPSRPVTPAVVAPVSPTPLTVPSVTSQTQITQAEVQPASDIEEMVTWFVGRNLQALKLSKMITKKHLLILSDITVYCILILLHAFLSCWYWYRYRLLWTAPSHRSVRSQNLPLSHCNTHIGDLPATVEVKLDPLFTQVLQNQRRQQWGLEHPKVKEFLSKTSMISTFVSSLSSLQNSVKRSVFHVELRDSLRIRGKTKVWLSKSESSAFFQTR